jgi:hypothetical protein
MSSRRRIAANRANGARSRGPVTPAGKKRSAANAITHGLLARVVVLGGEDSHAFQALVSDLVANLRPTNTLELTAVQELAASTWRQRRCWAIETRMVDVASSRNGSPSLSSIASAYAELADGPALDLIHRYETRVHRMYQRALKNLTVFRNNTKFPNEPNPDSEHGLPLDEPQDYSPEPVPEPEPASTPKTDPAPTPEPSRDAHESRDVNRSRDHKGAVPSPPTEPPQPPAPTPWTSSVAAFVIP